MGRDRSFEDSDLDKGVRAIERRRVGARHRSASARTVPRRRHETSPGDIARNRRQYQVTSCTFQFPLLVVATQLCRHPRCSHRPDRPTSLHSMPPSSTDTNRRPRNADPLPPPSSVPRRFFKTARIRAVRLPRRMIDQKSANTRRAADRRFRHRSILNLPAPPTANPHRTGECSCSPIRFTINPQEG